MKKFLQIFLFFSLFFIKTSPIFAEEPFYVINDFQSQITINQDTKLSVTEIIEVEFFENKHGIFRIIPVIYTANGRTIKSKIDIKSVTDENGQPLQYETSVFNESEKIKIGDPEKTLFGKHTYTITYSLSKILQRYKDYDELYWNVTGSEWDTIIKKASVQVVSPFARIINQICFSGIKGTKDTNCNFKEADMVFTSKQFLGAGKDMTIVLGLDKNNFLIFPNIWRETIIDNWGYLIAVIPTVFAVFFWFKKGRDKRYLSENIYQKLKKVPQTTVFPFAREFLPLVYSPIKELTPSQVGVIADEKVDTKDVVAEIVELARCGFIQIKKVSKKELIGTKFDYVFTKTEKNSEGLKNYQQYLLKTIFNKEALQDSQEDIKKFSIEPSSKTVLLSALKDNFYEHLETFKNELYTNIAQEGYFDGNPEKIRDKWQQYYFTIVFLFGLVTFLFAMTSGGNFFPLVTLVIFSPAGLWLMRHMPRKTAWGYSLHRQIDGLKYYLGVGKWREEIAEKNLFIEEILPLAISLGIVSKLAQDMKDLGLNSPEYMEEMEYKDFSLFARRAETNIISSPEDTGWSGKSSWSGGSGFSGGGSSGGGFGGGGGGSW